MLSSVVPWCPFLLACMSRAFAALTALLWVEGQAFGFAPPSLRAFAFYGALAFVGQAVLRQILSGALSIFAEPVPDLRVFSETGSFLADTVTWAACGMRGWRDSMEDAHVVQLLDASVFPEAALFAVLDGHGGKDVSALASRLLANEVLRCGQEALAVGAVAGGEGHLQKALEDALPRLDERMRRGSLGLGRIFPMALHPFSATGSTACVTAVDFKRREVLCANIGDSRAMLIRSGKAIALSEDHKPENPGERARIRGAGGHVIKTGPCHRVDGNLNLSRALGDFYLKANHQLPPDKQKVIAYPDCMRMPFQGGAQELLVVACDGLFEKRSNQDIADLIWPRLKSGMSLEQIGKEVLLACSARACRGRPVEEGTDNETIVLARLPPARGEAEGEELSAGRRVEIHGLGSEAGQSLNGQVGILEGPSQKGDRYDVRLVDAGGEVKSFKAANLRVARSAAKDQDD